MSDVPGPAGSSPASCFRTADLDEARECTSRTFSRHDVALYGHTALDFRLDLVQAESLTVARMAYGTEATAAGPPMEHCYHLNLPMTGRSSAAQRGRRKAVTGGGAGVVFVPDHAFEVALSADSWQYHVKVPRKALEAHAAKLAGVERTGPIEFDLTVDLRQPSRRALVASVRFLEEELSHRGPSAFPLASRELETAVMTHLLLTVPNRLDPDLHRRPRRARRATIRDVVDYVAREPGVETTSVDLAAMAGMSLRALQVGFREAVGMSPTAYLRAVRLDRVRAEIRSGASVTDAATRWGFFHLGRFAAYYRERFGELPSTTATDASREGGPPHDVQLTRGGVSAEWLR